MKRPFPLDPGQVRRALLEWYRAHKRDLPWRRPARARDPYAVLVSEMMLQQTTVAAVVPRYEAFLERFPDWAALAPAGEADLLAAWAGLGYYARARNLQKTARAVLALEPPRFPRDLDEARALPGIGDYTAGAVLSIAYGLRLPAVDGNVLRVISRLRALEGDIALPESRRRVRAVVAELVPEAEASDFNQSLMELGARICTPVVPACEECPVSRLCEARRLGLERSLPRSSPRPRAVGFDAECLLARKAGRVLLVRETGAPFWELPGTSGGILAKGRAATIPARTKPGGEKRDAAASRRRLARLLARLGIEASIGQPIGIFRHTVTWRSLRVQVFEGLVAQRAGKVGRQSRWMDSQDLVAFPVATTVRKALALEATRPAASRFTGTRSQEWNPLNSPLSSNVTRASRPSRSA